jgi:hypothetical protein
LTSKACGKGEYGSPTPQCDVQPTVGSKDRATWVETVEIPRIAGDDSRLVERQDPIWAAVDIHKVALWMKNETARITDPIIITEPSR